MDKIEMSQILKLLMISSLVIITPLLSSSLRTTYLYFLVNLLIIALVAEAGLLSFFFSNNDNNNATHKPPNNLITTTTTTNNNNNASSSSLEPSFSPDHQKRDQETILENPNKINSTKEGKKVEKCGSDENTNVKKGVLQKCPSTPSLFSIGGEDDDDEEEEEELSGQELFNKAETFIGDFYKQLKMQREESWNRLQDIYHKPFLPNN